jgi:hypothetical protein
MSTLILKQIVIDITIDDDVAIDRVVVLKIANDLSVALTISIDWLGVAIIMPANWSTSELPWR